MLTQLTHFVVVITALIYFTPTTPFDWHKPTYFVATIISCTLLSPHTYTAYRVAIISLSFRCYHNLTTGTPTVSTVLTITPVPTVLTQPTAYKFTINTATPLVVARWLPRGVNEGRPA